MKAKAFFGDCVYTYDVEDYAKMRLFLSPDGMSGVALKEDGDMVSVFKNKNLKDNGEKRIFSLISLAISNGAKKSRLLRFNACQLIRKIWIPRRS